MVLQAFKEPLPQDYFADGQKLKVRGKGRVEKRRNSLVDLLNDLRANIDFTGYQVNPDDASKFSSIAEAFAVADVNEPDGGLIKIVVADGIYPDDIDFGSDHPVIIESLNYKGAEITGNFTFSSTATKLQRFLINLFLDGNTIFVKDGTDLILDNCFGDGATINLDPSAGSVGYDIRYKNCFSGNQKIIETATSSGTRNMVVSGGSMTFSATSSVPVSIYKLALHLESLANGAWWHMDPYAMFDLNDAGGKLYFHNVVAPLVANSTTGLISGDAGAEVEFLNANFYGGGTPLYIGATNAVIRGFLRVWDTVAPATAPIGTIWEDPELKDTLVWDGVYWGNGSIFRKDLLVDVGSAAVSHTSGWTVPTGAGVINTSANALKALTAGGGATLYGISDGSDGDKFAESAALIKNSKASAKQASINVGGGDTIYVHSMTSTGTEGGTLAGSNDKDVRVVVYFTMPKTLPDV